MTEREQLYAKWDDVEARVRDAAESVLIPDEDEPMSDAEVRWAEEIARKITETT